MITLEHIAHGEHLRELADRAGGAKYNLERLDLLTPEMGSKLNQIADAYHLHCQEVLDHVATKLPKIILDNFTKCPTGILHGHYYPCLILMKNNRVNLTYGTGWASLRLMFDIETEEIYWDAFGLSVDRTELEPMKDLMLEELNKVVRRDVPACPPQI